MSLLAAKNNLQTINERSSWGILVMLKTCGNSTKDNLVTGIPSNFQVKLIKLDIKY